MTGATTSTGVAVSAKRSISPRIGSVTSPPEWNPPPSPRSTRSSAFPAAPQCRAISRSSGTFSITRRKAGCSIGSTRLQPSPPVESLGIERAVADIPIAAHVAHECGAFRSSLGAFGESPQVAAVSGRDQLALHDLATGAELARFDAPGGSSDLLALGSGMALSNHTAGNGVILIDLNRRAEIGRLPSSSLGGIRPVHMYLSPVIEGRQYA